MYNYAVIGCGAITRRGHLPALKKIKEICVTAVSDINTRRARKVAKKYGIPKYYKDYKEMLEREDIDVVIIATPTPTHHQIAVDVVSRGINVIIEKPLSMTIDEAVKIANLSLDNNVKAAVVQNYRYFPSVKSVKEIIRGGKIGAILGILGCAHSVFPTNWTRGKWMYHEKGVLYDYFPHLVDLVLWLIEFKRIESVYATGGDALRHAGFVNYSSVLMSFEDGTYATLETSWLVGTMLMQLTIKGTGGWIHLDVRWDHFSVWHGMSTPIDYTKDYILRMLRFTNHFLRGKFFILPLLSLENFHRDFLLFLKGARSERLATIGQAACVTGVLELAFKSIKAKQVQEFPEYLYQLIKK